jgi:hypothetical protein
MVKTRLKYSAKTVLTEPVQEPELRYNNLLKPG